MRLTTDRPAPGLSRVEFDELYRRQAPLVVRALTRYGVPDATVDDCVQEVFLTALRRWPSRDPDTSVAGWLYGISRRVASHHRRASERKVRRERRATPAASTSDPEAQSEARELAEFVAQFIEGLDDRYREVFVLSEIEAMSAPEIADALGLNVNTVYTRVNRTRSKFRSSLASRVGGKSS